jgi:hypothetical protein
MRQAFVGLVVVLGVASLGTTAKAQDAGGFADPFALYYGFYLPRQAALAAQPQPEDNLRDVAAQRQYSALRERAGLDQPVGVLGEDDLDPYRPFGSARGRSAGMKAAVTRDGRSNTNLRGGGHPSYFNRGLAKNYFPGHKSGIAAAAPRAPTPRTMGLSGALRPPGRGGMGGAGGMGMGMGGMR